MQITLTVVAGILGASRLANCAPSQSASEVLQGLSGQALAALNTTAPIARSTGCSLHCLTRERIGEPKAVLHTSPFEHTLISIPSRNL